MFEPQDDLKQDLQQNRGKDRDRERVDDDFGVVLHKQVQYDNIDQYVLRPGNKDQLPFGWGRYYYRGFIFCHSHLQ
jgi:hypothetical protein